MEEPLRLSAALALRLADEHCAARGDGSDCRWLHGFWQCLRLLEIAADPSRHAGFYAAGLGAAATGSPRVLISGAADYSMLAHAVAVLRAKGVEPKVTVLDTCEAPLRLNAWYAGRVDCTIETVRSSILEYRCPEPYDVICTHSFFGQFSVRERPRLLRAWRALLGPEGRVVTAHPLRPFGPDEPNRFTAEQAEWVRAAARARASELAALLETTPPDVLHRAEVYLGARYGYPVRSLDELRALFEESGFVLEHLESAAPAAGSGAELGGPGLRNARVRYAHIIARGWAPGR